MQKQRVSKQETPAETWRKIIGTNLKAARLSADKSLDDAASVSGLSIPFISLVESGKRGIRAMELRSMLRLYGYGLAYFMSQVHSISQSPQTTQTEAVCITKNDQRLTLDGELTLDGKGYYLQLLHPVHTPTDTVHLFLRLPSDTVLNETPISIPAQIRGYCIEGTFLIDFLNDEYVVREGDTFNYHGKEPHILRNFSKKDTSVIFTIEDGAF